MTEGWVIVWTRKPVCLLDHVTSMEIQSLYECLFLCIRVGVKRQFSGFLPKTKFVSTTSDFFSVTQLPACLSFLLNFYICFHLNFFLSFHLNFFPTSTLHSISSFFLFFFQTPIRLPFVLSASVPASIRQLDTR